MKTFLHRLWRYKTPIATLLLWLLIVVAAQQYMAANDISVAELVNEVRLLLVDHWYGPLLYIALYLLRPLVFIPASWITVLAGSVFGLWVGFALALFAGTLSALFPYALGRWFNRGVRTSAQAADNRLTRFAQGLRQRPFQSVLLMRLLFLPYDGVSLFAGSLRIPLFVFFTATALGNVGGALAYVGVGASIEGDITAGDIRFDPAVLLLSVVLFVVSALVSRWLRRRETAGEAPAVAQSLDSLDKRIQST